MIRGRISMRARVSLNDGWWSEGIVPTMIQPGQTFSCLPHRALELLRLGYADLDDATDEDVAAIAAVSDDPADTMLRLSLVVGLGPDRQGDTHGGT